MPQKPGLPVSRGAGCIVYRHDDDGTIHILLIHDRYERWSLPKGHLKPGESHAQAAIREVLEETQVTGEIGPLVAQIEYRVFKNGNACTKQVTFFLLRATAGVATPQIEEGIRAASWFTAAEAMTRIGYPQIRDILTQALRMIEEQHSINER